MGIGHGIWFTRSRGVNDSTKPLFECGAAKIDEQTNGQIHQAEICEQLLGMHRCEVLNRLNFDHNTTVDQQVYAKSFLEHHPIVFKGDRPLSLNLKPSSLERAGQNNLAHRFQKTWPERLVNVYARVDDRLE